VFGDANELLRRVEGRLAAVERALERIDRGERDRCVRCGTPLGDALLADPLLDRCPSCPN
jgi:RNA polymerase-binding transcription factor DksA